MDPSLTNSPQLNKKSPHTFTLNIKLILIVIIIISISFNAFFFVNKYSNEKNTTPKKIENSKIINPDNNENQKLEINNFFNFKIPTPLSSLKLEDLPNNANPNNVIEYKNHLWFAGDGSIIEYSMETGELVSYSDAKKANCARDLLLIDDYIYASCFIDNIDDAFGTVHELKTVYFTGHSGILKINPNTHKVEYIFAKKDGLLNGYNYELYPDNTDIWITTFDGLGRINTKTKKVDFYRKELGSPDANKTYSLDHVVVDKDYVWAIYGAHSESTGGVALYNKKTDTWKAFGLADLKEKQDRFDLDYHSGYFAKLIPNGIQLGFRDGSIGDYDRLVEKQYNYESEKWTIVGEHVATGEESIKTYKLLETVYPAPIKESFSDSNGLTQLRLANTNQIYNLNGRNNWILSPLINEKRYILTDATVDVVDNTAPFRQILIPLGEKILGNVQYGGGFTETPIQFLIDPESLLALIIDPSCEGMGCDTGQKIWLIDLQNKEIKKVYTAQNDLPSGDQFIEKMIMNKMDNFLILKKENLDEVFRINISNYDIIFKKNLQNK